jgi:hypothetical protein
MRIYVHLRAMLRDIIAVDRLFAIQGDCVCVCVCVREREREGEGGSCKADLLDIPGKCSASVA